MRPSTKRRAERIIAVCAAEIGEPACAVTGHSRRAALIPARHKAMWELRYALGLSLAQVGKLVGERDHTPAHAGSAKHQRLPDNGEAEPLGLGPVPKVSEELADRLRAAFARQSPAEVYSILYPHRELTILALRSSGLDA
jgi:hypothetical protein